MKIVGHAIVSRDGKIADRDGKMPPALRVEADWQRFQAALDAAQMVVLGRVGHHAHPNPGRRRLVLTSAVAQLAPDPADANAHLWNPAGLPFADVLTRLGVAGGTIAVTGGTRVFDYFLPLFTSFDLAEVGDLLLPDGRPCFTAGAPGEVLAASALHKARTEALAPGVTLTVWAR